MSVRILIIKSIILIVYVQQTLHLLKELVITVQLQEIVVFVAILMNAKFVNKHLKKIITETVFVLMILSHLQIIAASV